MFVGPSKQLVSYFLLHNVNVHLQLQERCYFQHALPVKGVKKQTGNTEMLY